MFERSGSFLDEKRNSCISHKSANSVEFRDQWLCREAVPMPQKPDILADIEGIAAKTGLPVDEVRWLLALPETSGRDSIEGIQDQAKSSNPPEDREAT